MPKEWGHIDDVGIGCYRKSLGDFSGNQDLPVFAGQTQSLPIVLLLRRLANNSTQTKHAGGSDHRRPLDKRAPVRLWSALSICMNKVEVLLSHGSWSPF